MRRKRTIAFRNLLIAPLLLTVAAGCKTKTDAISNYKSEIDSIGIVWVPDLREGIFDAELVQGASGMILK